MLIDFKIECKLHGKEEKFIYALTCPWQLRNSLD